jgi:hypothetical protein
MNNIFINIIFIIGIIFSGIFHVLGSFYFKYAKINKLSFLKIFLISMLFGILSYIVKIPIFYFFSQKMNIITINIIYIIITFILIILYSYFILNEKIPIYTIIISILILLLIILNYLLDIKNK